MLTGTILKKLKTMSTENKVEYRVRKITIMKKMCPFCHGTGKHDQKFGPGQFKAVNCIHCTNGVAPIEHMTEISLIDALTELGIRFILPASMKYTNDTNLNE